MIPLRNNLIVKIDDSIPNIGDIFISPDISKWKHADIQLGNSGTVIRVGEGNRHPKTAVLMKPQCRIGDRVRFSELSYPTFSVDNIKYVIISDQDVVGVERA
jgi:co-chaperonin GroES (HSP10)